MLPEMRRESFQQEEPLRNSRPGWAAALTCSTAGEGPGWTVHPVSVCRSWGWGEAHKDVSGWHFSKTGGLPPPLCSPYSPTLPATVVQVEQESVIPKFLKGLVVMPVHVACGGPKNLPSSAWEMGAETWSSLLV